MSQEIQIRGKRKERTGVVVSRAMHKTIVVKVERRVRHPFYGKEMKLMKKFLAHDERNEARLGDKVLIAETRPLSKRKRWRLVKVLPAGTDLKPRAEPGRAGAAPGLAGENQKTEIENQTT